MNHDYTHCLDYDKETCPKKCFRAELTEDLYQHKDQVDFMTSWAHLKGTRYCAGWRKSE